MKKVREEILKNMLQILEKTDEATLEKVGAFLHGVSIAIDTNAKNAESRSINSNTKKAEA